MAKQSAGIVLYRFHNGGLQVLLGHMGEPRHAHKQAGAWSIPKGELNKGEAARKAALREFEEEVGFKPTGALSSAVAKSPQLVTRSSCSWSASFTNSSIRRTSGASVPNRGSKCRSSYRMERSCLP